MCHKQVVLLVVVLVVSGTVLIPRPATATEHVVGDADGWRPGVNYTNWAMGKEFRVGDTLVFRYAKGQHNVYNVTGPDFKSCVVSATSLLRDSGSDVVTLKVEGRRWYLCGVAGHCQRGQKLVVTVLPAVAAAAPSPLPALAPTPLPAGWFPALPPSPPTAPAPTPAPPVVEPPTPGRALPTVLPSVALAAIVAVAVVAMA